MSEVVLLGRAGKLRVRLSTQRLRALHDAPRARWRRRSRSRRALAGSLCQAALSMIVRLAHAVNAGLDSAPAGGSMIGVMETKVSIGAFSRMTFLSVKALRHYHQIGLLEPTSVDPGSGYRHYSVAQVPVAQVIRRLRDLGMPLADVRRIRGQVVEQKRARGLVVLDHKDQGLLVHTRRKHCAGRISPPARRTWVRGRSRKPGRLRRRRASRRRSPRPGSADSGPREPGQHRCRPGARSDAEADRRPEAPAWCGRSVADGVAKPVSIRVSNPSHQALGCRTRTGPQRRVGRIPGLGQTYCHSRVELLGSPHESVDTMG
jgi:DNA-binding transcriptional MerR regulator